MDDEVIGHIRARAEKCRRLADMVHQPDIRETLLQMALDAEADLKRLTGRQGSGPNTVES